MCNTAAQPIRIHGESVGWQLISRQVTGCVFVLFLPWQAS